VSSLTKLLLTETHRTKVQETSGKKKTPLTLRVKVHQDLDLLAVSNSKGEIVFSPNSESIGVLTNFFPLPLDVEDCFFTNIVDSIFIEGWGREWGNVALTSSIQNQDIKDMILFFENVGLQHYQTFCSYQGFGRLYETGLLVPPDEKPKFEEMPSEDDLKGLELEHLNIAYLSTRPVFLNEYLGPYIVFSAHPSYIGMLTRIGDHASVCIHNPERGIVIMRVEDV